VQSFCKDGQNFREKLTTADIQLGAHAQHMIVFIGSKQTLCQTHEHQRQRRVNHGIALYFCERRNTNAVWQPGHAFYS
jgi:hypothetical protein